MLSDKLGGRGSNSQPCNMSGRARNLSSGAEGGRRMQEAVRVSTGLLYGQSLRSEENREGFLHPCTAERSRPFPPLWSQAGAPHSSAAGCWGSGQLWATAHAAAQCSKCCTLALSKQYLKADNLAANHQRYLFSKLFRGKVYQFIKHQDTWLGMYTGLW